MLTLEPPGKKVEIKSRSLIQRYMKNNFDKWFDFANDGTQGGQCWSLGLKREAIVFISGTTTTRQWITAAFKGSFKEGSGVISGGINSVGRASLSISLAGEKLPHNSVNYGPAAVRQRLQNPRASIQSPSDLCLDNSPCSSTVSLSDGSPSHHRPDTPVLRELPSTQCIFMHYYKMKKRVLWNYTMKAASGPHELPPGDHFPTEDPMVPSSSGERSGNNDMEFEEFPSPDAVSITKNR